MAYVGCVGLLTIIGIYIASLIVCYIFNPKKDMERLNALAQQYADEMGRGVPPPSPPTGPTVTSPP